MLTVGFILGTRRSGSTWLNTVLGSHAGTAALGEYSRTFTVPSHIACRLCEAEGLPSCRFLHGIEKVPAESAYEFAAERLNRSILIECSKLLDWPNRFLKCGTIDARFIHIARHPAGYYESERRRRPGDSIEAICAEWIEQNRNIGNYLHTSGRPSMLVSYELLADFPEVYFPPLCRFLGFEYDQRALRYWEFEHHGQCPTLLEKPLGADVRWKGTLTPAQITVATASPYAGEMAKRLALRW